ncbi:hypothetical protein [Anaerovibrio sp. RM50]|uniref:hypothetical protein n=1 Tax=Anaerovibrio sp. RM50 TaxID=1200557 RepID=UPI0004814869|nr:hypothetical protein [Anaerovibrio sp. RM50]
MTKERLREVLDDELQDVGFEYGGENHLIIPHGSKRYTVCYGDESKDYTNIDEMMNDKVFYGKSLNEIASQLTLHFY